MLCYDLSPVCPLSARVDSQINFSVVVHGRMQDLPRGANYFILFFFWGGGACDALRSHAFARGVRGYASPQKIFNVAIWCVLEHIFIIFLLSQSLKYHFYTKIIINCSHVFARGSRSMVRSPLIIFIKGCNL